MSEKPLSGRRSFLTHVGAGVTMVGTASAVPSAMAQDGQGAWQPARHMQDEWLEQIPGKHRLVFDTTESAGMSSALTYASNYYSANNSGYGLQNEDLAVIVIARHRSTPFAYNESIWSKYGATLSNFADPGKEASTRNAYGNQMNNLIRRGTHLAVCQLATRALAGMVARSVNGNADEIFTEISTNLLPNSHLVAAGIVAVSRAQEHGYALVHAV